MFELEGLGQFFGGPVSLSPDGRALAFTRLRPTKALRNHKMEYLWGNDRGDLWVQEAPGENATRVTNGAEEGVGYWAPEWSPDGRRLGLLSTRGDNVTLWVWEKSSKGLRQLTTRGVYYDPDHYRPFQWVDATHVLCPILPEGEQPLGMRAELQTPRIASAAWAKTPKGTEPTVSVLESGVPVDFSKRPQGQLVLIDVQTGATNVVTEGFARAVKQSPDHRSVAYCRQVSVFTPKPDEKIPAAVALRSACAVEVRGMNGASLAAGVAFPQDVLPETIRWSPDSRQLAFIGYEGSRDDPPKVYQYDLTSRKVVTVPLGRLDATPVFGIALPPRVHWTGSGNLIVQAIARAPGKPRSPLARPDWWLVGEATEPRCLTKEFKRAPENLWPEEGHRSFVGAADGGIWRVNTEDERPENLTRGFGREIGQLAWPYYSNRGNHEFPDPGRAYREIIFSVRDGGGLDYYLLRLDAKTIKPLKKPQRDVFVAAYSPESGSVIYCLEGRAGTYVWRSPTPFERFETVMEANAFLKQIAEGQFRSLDYTSLNGEKLKAWLLLPYGYEPAKRYPLITWIYAGSVAGPSPSPLDSINFVNALNRQIQSAHGYAVLFPSMPLGPIGGPDDPMLKLTNGVLPAVDEAIRQGIADPERLFLMGQSFGGYSTYGLVTQTNRFKAAISLAGLSNLISLYGTFDARFRYTDYPHEHLSPLVHVEPGSARMDSPPWQDLGRYLRNSPIFHVDRVQTPLMIIQGDMDAIAIQQGEEFFMSLYRQGKRAEFVRYWGEGHVLKSPANIRDMWSRIFAWFEAFGDIARDAQGSMVFEGGRVKSRNGAPAWTPAQFLDLEAHRAHR